MTFLNVPRLNLTADRRFAELMLISVAVFWGVGFPVMKAALADASVLTLLWFRFALAAGIFVPFAMTFRGSWDVGLVGQGIGLGALLFAAFYLLIFGLQNTTATQTGFLTGMTVLFVPLLSGLLLKQWPDRRAQVAALLTLFGLFLLTFKQGPFQVSTGDLMVIGGAFFLALHILAVDGTTSRRPDAVFVLTFLQLVTVAIVAFLANLGASAPILPKNFSPEFIGAVVLTALFATGYAIWVQTQFQRLTTPSRAAVIFSLEPVVAACAAGILLGETMGIVAAFGGICVVAAMIISR